MEGRRGTTDDFATTLFHLDLFSAALVELAKSIPVHSLILSSHLFFCLPLFLFSFTVPCRIVFAKSEDLETWSNHLSFRFLTRVRSLSYSPMAAINALFVFHHNFIKNRHWDEPFLMLQFIIFQRGSIIHLFSVLPYNYSESELKGSSVSHFKCRMTLDLWPFIHPVT